MDLRQLSLFDHPTNRHHQLRAKTKVLRLSGAKANVDKGIFGRLDRLLTRASLRHVDVLERRSNPEYGFLAHGQVIYNILYTRARGFPMTSTGEIWSTFPFRWKALCGILGWTPERVGADPRGC